MSLAELKPQPGPQTEFLSNDADIIVYGGAAGGGKSWALLFEPLRYINIPKFRGVIFRRTYPEIVNAGGLWEASMEMYPQLGGTPRMSDTSWTFPSGAKIKFSHLQHDKDKGKWQGAEVDYVGWDELTHFEASQFFYLFSRMRNPHTPIRTYIRCSTNPDATSWVKDYIAPWVDKDWRRLELERAAMADRRPRIAGSGEQLYVERDGEGFQFYWPEELEELGINKRRVRSLTFIKSLVTDNKYLVPDGNLDDSEYVANLYQLDIVTRMRLLEGDWNVDYGDTLFDKDKFMRVPDTKIPWKRLTNWVRYWDMASTDKDKDVYDKAAYTAGVLLAKDYLTGVVYIIDVFRGKLDPVDLHEMVYNIAHEDRAFVQSLRGRQSDVKIYMEQEPGSSGVDSIHGYARDLIGFQFEGDRVTGDKITRAGPLASASYNNLIRVREAPWTREYMNEVESYPLGRKLDQIDATAGGLAKIQERKPFVLV